MNCMNIKPIRSEAHRGYMPFITKPEKPVSTRRKSAITSKYAPVDEDTLNLLAK